jgi:hypothetical protein
MENFICSSYTRLAPSSTLLPRTDMEKATVPLLSQEQLNEPSYPTTLLYPSYHMHAELLESKLSMAGSDHSFPRRS